MRFRTFTVTVLLAAFTVPAGASPYPLAESGVTPTPGSRVDLGPQLVKEMLVSSSTPKLLDPDGTLANSRSAGSGLLFAPSATPLLG
jgi:hypothetical protein